MATSKEVEFKLDRFHFVRGYEWDFSISLKTSDPLDPTVLVEVDPAGWTAELEIRDKDKVLLVRLQTTPGPSGGSTSSQGSITINGSLKTFNFSFVSSARLIPPGAHSIECKAFDLAGKEWPLIPLRPCDVVDTIMRGA